MLSVLIVGCGNIAGGFDAEQRDVSLPWTHAGAYARHEGFTVTACVEPNEDVRYRFAQRWNVPQGYESIADVVAAGDHFDVVSICSPTDSHARDLEAALVLGPRLVFCEKPVTPSFKDSKAILERYSAAGIPVAVNHIRRWDSSARQLASELKEGKWGAVRSASALYTKGVINNGSHLFDLLAMLLGHLEVQVVGKPIVDMWEDDPSIPVMLLANGTVPICVNCGFARDYSLFELQIVTERGVIAMEGGGLTWRTRRAIDSATFKGYRSLGDGEMIAGKLAESMLLAVDEIHDVLENGGALSSTAENALGAQRVCDSILTLATQSRHMSDGRT